VRKEQVFTVGVELNVLGSLVLGLLEVEILGLVGETELVEKGSDLPAVRLRATFFERSGLLKGRVTEIIYLRRRPARRE
jgi:hypothetical protein